MLNDVTITAIISIFTSFTLFMGAFYSAMKGRKRAAIGLGVAAFVFMTLIPVMLAVFGAAPNAG